ncbi:hypothetical protein RJ640_013668 [Escallonia rubra]|uniref:Triacylglycerol lipase n=1 Tax=Escallonia rubra TaxID=112253 RepID=A0AA88UBW4_9ASTE|nr:hypothetical protein RJ640_013668 [Escallonia rubra]
MTTSTDTNSVKARARTGPYSIDGQYGLCASMVKTEGYVCEEHTDLLWLGIHEFAPRGTHRNATSFARKAVAQLLEDICKQPDVNCSDLMTSFTGKNCCVNSSQTNNFLEHEPQSTATRNMIHLAQMIRRGTIAMYDYGSEDENNKHYGQPTPPEYNMTSIPNDIPLFLGYGGQDLLSDVKDVQTLLDSLHDHEADKLVVQYTEDYAHADFVFGVNAKEVVYNPLMAFFKLQ